jgi:hypothetical protein
VEHEREKDTIFEAMLLDKDPLYLKRTVNMIIDWKRSSYDSNIIHIHGDRDKTLPLKNIQCDWKIPGGTHMMVYFRAEEISGLIKRIVKDIY